MQKSIHRPQHKLVCAQLRAARESAGLTQVAFAKRVKTTQAWVSSVETGITRLDLVQLWDWCKACRVSLPDFVAAVSEGFAKLPVSRKAAPRARKSSKAGSEKEPDASA
jgi:transcriptional regulator with XRE-family HTH domain